MNSHHPLFFLSSDQGQENFYAKVLYAMGTEKIKEKINPYLKLSIPDKSTFGSDVTRYTNHRHW